jgi:hypothetical protein
MACAPFPGHSALGMVFCNVFYVLALFFRCLIGIPEMGASVELSIPSLSSMTGIQYAAVFLGISQACAVVAFCFEDAFTHNEWGALGLVLSVVGLAWIVLRNWPMLTSDVEELGAFNRAASMSMSTLLEFLACVGPDLLIFNSNTKLLFGKSDSPALPVLTCVVLGGFVCCCVFIVYANQNGSSFSLDVSNEKEDSLISRIVRNIVGLVTVTLTIMIGILGLAATFVSITLSGSSVNWEYKQLEASSIELRATVMIVLVNLFMVAFHFFIVPKCHSCTSGAVSQVQPSAPA